MDLVCAFFVVPGLALCSAGLNTSAWTSVPSVRWPGPFALLTARDVASDVPPGLEPPRSGKLAFSSLLSRLSPKFVILMASLLARLLWEAIRT